jgi:hypothetical protein
VGRETIEREELLGSLEDTYNVAAFIPATTTTRATTTPCAYLRLPLREEV